MYGTNTWPSCFQGPSNMIASIHIENLDELDKLPTEVMEDLSLKYKIPEDKQVKYVHFVQFAANNISVRLEIILMKCQTMLLCR